MKSKVITISAISAAFSAIFLTFGAYFEFADLFCIIFASISIMLPLYYKSYLGCFLAFCAGGIMAFLLSGFNILSLVFVSYFGFGCYPFVACLLRDKGLKNIVVYIIGLVWCVAVLYGIFFYYINIMDRTLSDFPQWFVDGIYYFIPLLSIVFYFVFDWFVIIFRRFLEIYLKKIIK